ncbi:pleckstrin homology domain-containing family G member 7 [Myxocyprinus asiaticus]|uniref:pleckstrin homology domain-containing family G member 7 n=1 Tax=Myxocyprinus asiaticus TaxID=70543 RepID=UPI0022228833|nr:pleckstrin homology domain-containing family G member 7 [Myxocyprinus asiaticus]XP_051513200.1 pleckstrin homology domain-containing family G member 7 [Myxocyprinus asiaticus]
MTELNYAFIRENRKEMDEALDWSYIEWHEKETVKGTDAQTQTKCEQTEDKETQMSNPFIMQTDLGRTPSRLRYGSLKEGDGMSAHLFQFDRQALSRISTSPMLRRMRSTRISSRELGRFDGPLGEETLPPRSPLSPLFLQKSPLAFQSDGEGGNFKSSVIHGKSRWQRSKTLDNGLTGNSHESLDSKEVVSDDNESTTDDSDQGDEPYHKRLQERRRSSVVVSLPGLDVSPGDLFVSNGAADILNKSAYSDTKKSKWPFSRSNTAKGKADIDKCLAGIQIQEWRDTDFQTYKDMSLEEFLSGRSELGAAENPKAYRKQEAIWELFTSECVYFLDQLMVLKEVFLTTLSDLQMRECLQDIDSWRLFANLNELCLVSFGILTSLLRVIKELWTNPDSDSTQILLELLIKAFGESICHCLQKYCLNYSTAILYLDSLKFREDFGSFVKWCERNEQCRRLQLKDLLVAPLQRFTRYPLLLKNIGKRGCSEEEEGTLQRIVDIIDRAIYDLEGKVKWLDNYQKVKQLKETLVWLPVWERDKKAHVPENLKHLLKAVTMENLVSQRSLLYDGKLVLIENAKLQDVYLFLFDEFLLITKIKRSKKKSNAVESNPLRPAVGQELEILMQEGCSFTVLDQPISLDRLQLKNIDQLNATASGLPNSLIIMHQNRYQQCIGVFILQAQSESIKKGWMSEIEDAINSLLKQDCQQPRVKNSMLYLESSQI